MRENQIIPKEPWDLEKTKSVLERVVGEVADINREINFVNSRIAEWQEKKKHLCRKYSKKVRYRNLIQNQIRENFWT